MDETAREPVLVDLALQGGGSHGAFTWGVLDRLIEHAPGERAVGATALQGEVHQNLFAHCLVHRPPLRSG